jgi:hypothetical protein
MLFSLWAVVQETLEAVWERGKILFILFSLQLGQKLLSEGSNLKVWLVESLCEARPWWGCSVRRRAIELETLLP